MRIPYRFTYRGQEWRVLWKRPPGCEGEDCDDCRGGGCHGETYYASKTIYLNPTKAKDKEEQLDSFIHELLHAMDETEEDLGTKGWHLSHTAINRVADALSVLLVENGWGWPSEGR